MAHILMWVVVLLSCTLNICVFYYVKAIAQKKKKKNKHPQLKMAGESSKQHSILYVLHSS